MGAIFASVFFMILLAIGLVGIVAGTVGLVIRGQRRKAGKTFPTALTAACAVVLSIGIVTAMISTGFVSFIVIVNSTPPEGFVETEIVIEEDGYQDTRFTADGVVYEVLDLEVHDASAISTPIFTYKTKGFLNRSQCGNYYAIENSQGFRLVSNQWGTLFAPTEEKERILAYYTNVENLCAYYDDWNGREFKLSDGDTKALYKFVEEDLRALPKTQLISEDEETFQIKLVCKEGKVRMAWHCFLHVNGEVYYVSETDFIEGEGFQYTVLALPDEVAEALLERYING